VLTGPAERSGACGYMDDVIGQGREPEADPRPPLPRRWRVAGWALAAVAGLAVVGVGLRHGSASPGAPPGSAGSTTPPAAVAGGGAPASVSLVPAAVLPLPQSHAAFVMCSPSTGVCSMRGNGEQVVLRPVKLDVPVPVQPAQG
jgi:hypothetical protein